MKIGIGRIEAVATDLGGRVEGRKGWHVHAHVIIDVGDHALDVKAVRADFGRLTKRRTKRDRSYVAIQEIRSDDAVDRYITKARGVKERGKKKSRAMVTKTRRKAATKAIRTSRPSNRGDRRSLRP